MARGNQREKAREKNLKKTEKTKTTMSGTEMQHAKESNAEIMRKKQAAGMFNRSNSYRLALDHNKNTVALWKGRRNTDTTITAEARKAAEGKK
ncbi:hypothetical protein ACLX1H_001621 [Fusarium chlamydosporum]